MTWVLFLLLHIKPQQTPPIPPREVAIDAFVKLGCSCSERIPGALECGSLLEFEENVWVHPDADTFANKAKDFAVRVETMTKDFGGIYYLALQGSADSQEIGTKKQWGEASDECRVGHERSEPIDNDDLASLRACELKRMLSDPLKKNLRILNPLDYTNPKLNGGHKKDFEGGRYRGVTLFIIFTDGEPCAHAARQEK
jgi:hypothetical protein